MTRFGIGPLLAPLSISYFVATVALAIHFDPLFRLAGISTALRIGIGVICISVGIALYVAGVHSMLKAYNTDRLCTTGVFGICRHPIYSAWICFIVPGMAFWANSLLSFTTPLVMYVLFKVLIKKEDRYLKEKFGSEYQLYKEKTPELMPFGWLNKTQA